MQVFSHYLYEYRKGVRNMILCTLPGALEDKVKTKLEKKGICYLIERLENGNFNVFFGKEECLAVVNKICKGKALNKLTPEEDFMLGILLGYSVCQQCRRYYKKQEEKRTILSL